MTCQGGKAKARVARDGGGRPRTASGKLRLRVVPHSPLRLPPSKGFTLVELLISITILGILTSLVLGVGAVARETARQAKTKQLIARLHTLLVDRYDEFRNRRVSLSDTAEGIIRNASGPLRGQLNAEARLHALNEVLLMELPDRWSDLLMGPVPTNIEAIVNDKVNIAGDGTAVNEPAYAAERTAVGNLFYRRLQQAAQGAIDTTNTPAEARERLLENQSAECLYMIVILTTGDGEAAGLFNETLIGDTDGDGAREFLDAWGNPIQFLRWAPGADSPAQHSLSALRLVRDDAVDNGATDDEANAAVARAVFNDRNPFDLFRSMQYTSASAARLTSSTPASGAFGFRLLPLIYSLGGDEESGVTDAITLPDLPGSGAGDGYLAWDATTTLTVATAPGATGLRFEAAPEPYRLLDSTDGATGGQVDFQVGHPFDRDRSTDNLTNHLITAQ